MSMHLTSTETASVLRLVGIGDCALTVATAELPIAIVGDAPSILAFASAVRKACLVFTFVGDYIFGWR